VPTITSGQTDKHTHRHANGNTTGGEIDMITLSKKTDKPILMSDSVEHGTVRVAAIVWQKGPDVTWLA